MLWANFVADILWVMGELEPEDRARIDGPGGVFANHFVNEVRVGRTLVRCGGAGTRLRVLHPSQFVCVPLRAGACVCVRVRVNGTGRYIAIVD